MATTETRPPASPPTAEAARAEMGLGEFVTRTRPHTRVRAPIGATMRRLAWAGVATGLANCAVLATAGGLGEALASLDAPIVGQALWVALLTWGGHADQVAWAATALLLGHLALGVATRGFRRGGAGQQRAVATTTLAALASLTPAAVVALVLAVHLAVALLLATVLVVAGGAIAAAGIATALDSA
jgi:hypothetical protein